MVRTQRVLRSQIIDGAYQLIINEGFKKFHARNIAQHIACSTQPIYREFANLAELKTVLTNRILVKYSDFLEDQEPKSLQTLSNTIMNYALDYPEEFQRFFLQDSDTIQLVKQVTKEVFTANKLEKNNDLFFDFFWQYCIGKAALAINNANHTPDLEEDRFFQFSLEN
ncbi:TetR/AcrR family transcriptional regulator [Enterococcus dongliensis]|uniref:TetR/AcrR family transcriptional regulator n=2 Tax=Enterococcus dongliensis TaxID=2559925 RepID=A0AAP5KQP6_9ENTE|nr:TetR/AcrR family transcriptional regulator [Enterococcus dongliensis]MDT2596594.1 TetR/AcrR family transcriptional regulator [Enterococcus dongliensis]MDT2603659.1 TetR/AcrR family transcriptional regulator [Enterococcus dongliensis]MDT2612613.1 TetR/AcrR family transcriptional regulator [Enterococcus dongliensis]MDT2634420.1 TetR/AcrR family transcriptional regulator [Enterococcus dongliensis]MDT2637379.1 TetR/AcrR family transcriptional regulator [Enterococcus dongliensis]